MQVLELADEFHLTTGEALEICVAAGVEDADATTELTSAQTTRWRELATARQEWMERVPARAGSSFGPLPPAPWEPTSDGTIPTAPAGAPTMHARDPGPLGSGWGTGDDGSAHVSPYAPAALALAVISLIFPFIPGFGALALAWYAKSRIERSKGRETGERLATAAQIVAAIGITLWLLLLAFTVYTDVRDDAAARDDGQVETGVLGWDEIRSGDCVRIPRADLAVADWTELDCGAPHEAEVYVIEQVAPTTIDDGPYPGKGALTPAVSRMCEERFEDYVGIPYETSTLRIAVFYPTGANWSAADDRTLGCIVFREGYALIDGTLEGSGR